MKNIFSALCLLTVSSVGFSQIVLSPGSSANVSGQEVRCESSSIVKPKVCSIVGQSTYTVDNDGMISNSIEIRIDGEYKTSAQKLDDALITLHNLINSNECDVVKAENCLLDLRLQSPVPKYSRESTRIKIGAYIFAESALNQTGAMPYGSAVKLYDQAIQLGLCLK
jgi:hypothetical protein